LGQTERVTPAGRRIDDFVGAQHAVPADFQ
jgi:hypothetical protein